MLTDDALSAILASLPADTRARVRELIRLGWALEAERLLAEVLADPPKAKEIIASMVRQALTS